MEKNSSQNKVTANTAVMSKTLLGIMRIVTHLERQIYCIVRCTALCRLVSAHNVSANHSCLRVYLKQMQGLQLLAITYDLKHKHFDKRMYTDELTLILPISC